MHLHVAEKPSVASQLAKILSNGNYEYEAGNRLYTLNSFIGPSKFCQSTVTSVQGHIFGLDYVDKSPWYLDTITSLFEAPVQPQANETSFSIIRRLKYLARDVETLFIWTDCDREGENIGWEIAHTVSEIRHVATYRMRFSGLSRQDVQNAFNSLQGLDDRIVKAVDCRSEIDLRTGAIFTRFQTLKLRCFFEAKAVLSYGTCQFPTLGFVIEQYRKVCSCKDSMKWSLDVQLRTGRHSCKLVWERGFLFDRLIVMCYKDLVSGGIAQLTKVERKQVFKLKPIPLRTVELQKHLSSMLKMSAKDIMKTGEQLYHEGYISYPRTETDSYSSSFDFKGILSSISNDSVVGGFAQSLLSTEIDPPRRGRNDDKAHPPIHPLKAGTELSGQARRIYEYITRRFLAGLMKNAEGIQTKYIFLINDETFSAEGRSVSARNYLEVYIYEKWPDISLPQLSTPFSTTKYQVSVHELSLARPRLLNEAMLIATMDRNQIGTDATIHEIIEKVAQRSYVLRSKSGYLPTKLGLLLCEFYDRFAPDYSLSKPDLRKQMELAFQDICAGKSTKQQVVSHYVNKYHTLYSRVASSFQQLIHDIERNKVI
jgi:DNA topoisomerase-3